MVAIVTSGREGLQKRRIGILVLGLLMVAPASARALVLQVPIGANAFTLPEGRFLCGDAPDGWQVDGSNRQLTPPAKARVGQTYNVTLATADSVCSTGPVEKSTLILTGNFPVIEPASVTVSVDVGRLELRGRGLEGVKLVWKFGDRSGSDSCVNVAKDKGGERCAIEIAEDLPVDPRVLLLRWAPPGGRSDANVVTYDSAGSPVADEQMRLSAARAIIGRIFPESSTVDIASGGGRVELVHREAVASVECGAARCELVDNGLVVRAVSAALNTISVKLRLLPRVFLSRGDELENAPTEQLSVLRCPLTMVSGEPLRNVDNLRVLVRLDKSCSKEVEHLRWTAGGESAEVARTETLSDGVYLLLRVARVSSDKLTVVASRGEYGSVLAVTSERTWQVPPLRTSLRLATFGDIDFIPKNRDALLSVSPVSRVGKLVPISVPGAYTVIKQKDGFCVRGEYTSGGYTAINFGYRLSSVPDSFAKTDFATLVDPVQRPIREASVPAPLGASSLTKRPIVELFCSVGKGKLRSIAPGTAPHIPFSERDSCRLVIYRDRIPAEYGEQRVDIDVSVDAVSGSRPEAKLTQRLVLRHGPYKDVIWIHGAKEQFDRINVRVTHIMDESLYVSHAGRAEIPTAQWTVVTESAFLKFYVTVAIPTGLYRVSIPKDRENLGNGPLAVNFGVLSRLTWLSSEGTEGIVGLEGGIMAMGLATANEQQLALVGGLGLSVPLGNVNQPWQASVNVHAWFAYSIGKREATLADSSDKVRLHSWAFVFGPGITIGNIGAFL